MRSPTHPPRLRACRRGALAARLALAASLLPALPALAACRDARPASGPWFATVSPSESGERSTRDHLFAAACPALHPDHGPWPAPRVQARAGALPGVYNAATRSAGEVFVLGGAYGRIDAMNGPYVAALSADPLRERWRTRLPGVGPAQWNYPGALGVHRNGDLYVAYGPRLARLDAATGAVKAVLALPTAQRAEDVAYNGFMLLADGSIVTKSIHRRPGCDAPDFEAFLRCETRGVAASTLAVVDAERMVVRHHVVAPEHVRFRATVASVDGREFVYLPGERQLHRYRWDGAVLAHDPHWRVDYLAPGQTAGTAVAAMGDWVVVQTNGIPTEAPMSLVAVSQRDAGRRFRHTPFADAAGKGSFIPSLPTVDPERRRIYTFDGYVGEAAAVDFDESGGLTTAWRVAQRSFAFSMLVGPPQARVWIATDMRHWRVRLGFALLGFDRLRRATAGAKPTAEDLVWRDARTGRELGRVGTAAAVGGGAPVPGFGAVVWLPDLSGRALVRVGPP